MTFEIIFFFFPENRLWHCMWIVSLGICMKCWSLLSGKKKETFHQFVICWICPQSGKYFLSKTKRLNSYHSVALFCRTSLRLMSSAIRSEVSCLSLDGCFGGKMGPLYGCAGGSTGWYPGICSPVADSISASSSEKLTSCNSENKQFKNYRLIQENCVYYPFPNQALTVNVLKLQPSYGIICLPKFFFFLYFIFVFLVYFILFFVCKVLFFI